MVPDSGMICVANETPKVGLHFVPSLGRAPRWASYLEAVTEELEHNCSVGHSKEEFRGLTFVDKEELLRMKALPLIKTNALKPYLHGWFMDSVLYRKVADVADP